MFIRLEPGSGVPITRQIADQIAALCASAALRPGDQLPSVRTLAAELAVNQNTILRVYERLTNDGLLERRHGSGTFVAARLPAGQMKGQRVLLQQEVARLVARARVLGLEGADIHKLIDQELERGPQRGSHQREADDE
jgi:GntR family transcriptional regulator